MARKSSYIKTNQITRDMIKRCQNCEVHKICTIPIAEIAHSQFCLHPNAENKIYVVQTKE